MTSLKRQLPIHRHSIVRMEMHVVTYLTRVSISQACNFSRVLLKLARFTWISILFLESTVAFAGFGGPRNPDSRHELYACNTPQSTIYQSFSMTQVSETACAEYASLHSNASVTSYWTTCNLQSQARDGYAGATWAPFDTDGEIITVRNSDGAVIQDARGSWALVTCGCNAANENLVGAGPDAACYCQAGYDWDDPNQICIPATPKFYTRADIPVALKPAQCDICVGDPINPANGAVFRAEPGEVSDRRLVSLKRFYNSKASSSDLGANWRHGFSREVQPRYSAISYQPYTASDPNNSSLYNDAASACVNGFAQIKSRVPAWQSAAAVYANGICSLTVGTTNIGALPILYASSSLLVSGTTVVGFDVTRDDGQLISFTVNGDNIAAPPSINLKLQQTSTGYLLTDANDNVESYDSSGKLQSITSRIGVIQTLSYDSSGRLSGVTDNFGHSLILSYDSNGKLSTLARP